MAPIPNWQAELAPPAAEITMLSYWRQTIIHAWERSLYPVPGPVHLNIPFRDPLVPTPQPEADILKSQFQPRDFFSSIPHTPCPLPHAPCPLPLIPGWHQCEQGVIIAGPAQPHLPLDYCAAIAQLSKSLGWPVLAEGLSPLRNYAQLNPYLIATYDLILRNPQLAHQLAPKMVIQVGELPTSKELRTWLNTTQPQRWVIDPSHHNFDPLHGKTTHLRTSVEQLALLVGATRRVAPTGVAPTGVAPTGVAPTGVAHSSQYLQEWCTAEAKVRSAINQTMVTMEQIFEGKAAWLLSQTLPPETPLFVANSMPVRDVECFWQPSDLAIKPFFNRGANGIDGTLSTALGVAHRNQSSVMLTGDLALLHDTNGFLLRNKFQGHLTILLINNNGGGIFEMLPVSKFDPPFEEFFATPQNINFAHLCITYGVEHQLIQSWEQLKQGLNPLPTQGIRVLELQTNRKADARWRREHLSRFASDLGVLNNL